MVIVAAVDHSESGPAVVAEGAKLANAFEEPLHVVHILDRSTFLELERSTVEDSRKSVPVDEVRSMAKEIAGDAARDVAPNADLVGIVGDPGEEILRYAEENNSSYVVVGGKERSPVGKAIFGSVTQSVLLKACRPTVTVHTDKQ